MNAIMKENMAKNESTIAATHRSSSNTMDINKPSNAKNHPIKINIGTAKPREFPNVLTGVVGVVCNILNDNYGVAAMVLPHSQTDSRTLKGPFKVLFDTCEFWVGAHLSSDKQIPLTR